VNNGCPLSCRLGCARQRLRVGSSPPLTLLVQETEQCSRMYVRSSHDSDPARESRKRCQDGSVAAGAEAGTALKGTRPWWQWHYSDDCSYMIGRWRLLLCIMRIRRTFQRGAPRGLCMRRVLKTCYINLASTQTRTEEPTQIIPPLLPFTFSCQPNVSPAIRIRLEEPTGEYLRTLKNSCSPQRHRSR
jgi:hypothetical protein